MIAGLGYTALLLALAAALLLGALPLAGASRKHAGWMALARPLAHAHGALVGVAFGCLAFAFLRLDFSIAYVAGHASHALPAGYRLAAVWGGHEGSLLLWLAVLAGWMVAVARSARGWPAAFGARVLGVLGLVGAGFLLMLLATANPFERLSPVPADGRDLNPLLQDPAMAAHPPLLYMGYVGFAVAFAFAVAALLEGGPGRDWARRARPWAAAAWCCLTLGIALGSWWAYYELGWGGWWFWDPVENAAFMPWLAGTALLHSLAVTAQRGAFAPWSVLLALLAFALSLLGTFLVRSGLLSSVHAFTSDPTRGLALLAFLALVAGGSLALYAWRAPALSPGPRFGLVSREGALLGNNLLLLVACATVLIGTLYPLALDALGLGPISVGAPYFETVLLPVFGLLALLLGAGPLARWRQDAPGRVAWRLRGPALIALLGAGATAGLVGAGGVGALLGFAMAYWIAAAVAVEAWSRLRPRPAGASVAPPPGAPTPLPRAVLGLLLAHLGVAVFAFGVSMVKAGGQERDLTLAPGEAAELAGYRFVFWGVRPSGGPTHEGVQGLVEVTRDGAAVALLQPEKRVYRARRSPTTEAAIDGGFTRDLLVSLGQPLPGGAWSLRVAVKPFVRWIWGGCLLMALGGALAAGVARRPARRPASPAAAALGAAGQAGLDARGGTAVEARA